MPDDNERLIVLVEARIRDLEKNMAKASGTTGREFGKMRRDSKSATAAMEQDMLRSTSRINQALATTSSRIGEFGKGALKGFGASLAAVGVAGAVQGFRDLATSVANVGNEARRAGLSTKAFQELKFVAEQSRIPVDALVDGMKELSLRADEFVTTGGGSAAEAFKRIGLSASMLKEKLKDPSALLVEIVERMQKLDRAAQIRIFDELAGGTGGEQMVELLDKGAAGIRQMIQDANDFGLILDEKMIAKADAVDRKFGLIVNTVGTRLKTAIVEAAEALGGFFDEMDKRENALSKRLSNAGNAEWIARFNDWMGYNDPEAMRKAGLEPAAGAKSFSPDSRIANAFDVTAQTATVAGDKVGRLGTAAEEAARKLSAVPAPGAGTPSFRQSEASSMSALKRYLDGDSRDVAKRGMLDLIGYAEGTDKGRGYNETLGYGKFTGGDVNLTAMTLKEVLALQKQMLAHPDNGFNSSAVGRYQIVSKTMKGLIGEMGLSGEERFDPAMQDRMAEQLLRRRGNDVGGLRNEWEGLRNIPDASIKTALGVTQPDMAPMDEGIQTAIDKRRELGQSYQEIIAQGVEFIAGQNAEVAALGLTTEKAAALRYEQELLNQAAAAGLEVTPQQAQQFRMLAAGMAEAETAATGFAESQERAAEAQAAFKGLAKDSLRGFISDLQSGKSAGEALANTLSRIADRLLDMALDDIFSGMGGAGGGSGGGLFAGIGKFFGFKSGGPVRAATGGSIRGPGTGTSDSIPAWLSDGEFVVNAKAAKKNKGLLHAINEEMLGYASGGGVHAMRGTAEFGTEANIVEVRQ